ncbi:MAG: LysR substrate-binding domain-containing protein [Myxococcota bacterium]
MRRSHLGDMAVFVEVARARGFRAAAERLKLRASSVSEAVQRFEDRLGVRLLERSTRSVALTPLGEQLYTRSLPAIRDLESALRDLHEDQQGVSGTLRITAPYSAGPFFLDELVAVYLRAHPDVRVELIYDDQKVDLIEGGVDVAIRSRTLLEPDTHALPVGPELTMAVVAAPAYLEANGTPGLPHDLLEHQGICFAFSRERLAPWNFVGNEGLYTVMPEARVIANDLPSLLSYARSGLGLAYVYARVAKPQLDAGALVEVLRDHTPTLPRYSLNYRSKRNMTHRLRAFLDTAKAQGAS